MKILVVSVLVALPVLAQPFLQPSSNPLCPGIILGIGGGVVRNSGQINTAEGSVSALLNIGGCNMAGTNVDMASVNGLPSNTIRAEFANLHPFGKLADGTARFLVGPVVSAGTATTAPVIGSFAGGLYAGWNLGAIKPSLSGLMLTGELRVTGATQTVSSSTFAANGITTVTSITQTPTNQVGQVSVGLYLSVSYSFR